MKVLSGIFGTNAVLITDLNLLIQIISFVVLLFALVNKMKKRFKMHGSFMGAAVFLHLISFLVAMAPSFVLGFDYFITYTLEIGVQMIWIHAVTGAVSLVLGLFLILAWVPRASNIKPCFGRKRIMDVTVALWATSLIFGIIAYIIYYV
jgi:uncharacterized membrane protein YozB (DUF420 family)